MDTKTTVIFSFLFSLLFHIGLSLGQDYNIQMECRINCETEMLSSEGGSELFCDKHCSINQCHKGCSLYQDAVDSSCEKACASSYQKSFNTSQRHAATKDEMWNCIQGCIFALDEYVYLIELHLGFPTRPIPERQSIGHSSVTLLWKNPILENVTYRVHVKVIDVDSGWHLHANSTFLPDGKILVTNLHPYVTYKFKILAMMSSLPSHIIKSPETVEITTLARGKPSTSPTITSITTPSPTVISLSWRPPLFTNGKLLSYRIYVQPVGHRHLNLTTIEIPYNATSWLLSQLKSSQPYVISLSARNARGEGPKTSKTISTPNPGNLSAKETPYLILGANNQIVKRNLLDVIQYDADTSDTIHNLDDRTVQGWTVLYELPRSSTTGMSLHIRRQLMLATDSAGDVIRISLGDNTLVSVNHYPSILGARAISIDWLEDKVYVASWNRITWQIHSCPLDVDQCIPIVKDIHRPITDVKVDPINGFLFFVINGEGHGLYRIDLQDISDFLTSSSTSLASHNARPAQKLIASMPELYTCIIDFSSVHLYLVNDGKKMMMSAFLDGTNILPFHDNNINSAFKHVTSAVFYNETFIWTDNKEMYIEYYEAHSKNYRHNELLFFNPNYTGISIYHPIAQPIPVPSVAPDQLQVLFTKDKAVVQWKPPTQLQYQGRGAWKNWTYELEISPLSLSGSKPVSTIKAFKTAKLTIQNLKPDAEYSVKIRAKSPTGYGPWSDNFIGKTLKEDGLHVLMGIAGGRIVEQEVGLSSHFNAINFFKDATDIAWHEDVVLWTTESGSLSVMNTTNNHRRQLTAAQQAHCVGFDWLGHKVYWAELGVIRRTDIKSITSSSEYIHQSAARDIGVDSVGGRLYWATQHSVETSYLNGDEHQDLFKLKHYIGPQVISLALESDSSKVFWYVKGYKTQGLYMTQLMSDEGGKQYFPKEQYLGDFETIASSSGLQSFSGRLFWLTEQNSLVVGNEECNFMASVSDFSNITAFTVKHPQMHKLPNGLSRESLQVIPNPIRSPDIKTLGDWSKFNLTWPKSREVNHGTVFYKVVVGIGRDSYQFTTSKSWHEISGLSPYTKVDVTIKPYTVWGNADPTTVSVRSPMSKPTAPLSPEVYIKPYKNATASIQSLAADFRWNSPHLSNGIISHHFVKHWMLTEKDRPIKGLQVEKVSGTARHFILPHLIKSQTYHFNVVACNEAGCGPPSETKTATTDALNPIPTLLVASKKGLMLTEMDGRLNSSTVMSDIVPVAVTFLSHDPPRMFWMDQRRNFLYENIEAPFKELTKLKGRGKHLTIDWISRTLYIVETMGVKKSSIMTFNIDQQTYTELVVRSATIGTIIADPFNRAVMWTETNTEGKGQILAIDVKTKQIRTVVGSTQRSKRSIFRRSCSCQDSMDVASAITIDYASGDGSTRVIFTDKNSKTIYSSDIQGCDCKPILPLSALDGLESAPELLAVDHMQVSCYSQVKGKLYSVKKVDGKINIKHEIPNILDIVAYGSHLQPLPDSVCLDPGVYNSTVQQMEVNSTSIRLRLIAPTRPESCQKISTPVDKYTIYHRPVVRTKTGTAPLDCQHDLAACLKEETHSTKVSLSGLKPYTQHLIQVAVSNYYTEYLSEELGTPIIITTKIGVPSNARDLVSSPVTPSAIFVQWLPPEDFNGPPNQISYIVQYSTTTAEGSEQKEMQHIGDTNAQVNVTLNGLRPDHTYSISIRTCPANKEMCNVAAPVETHTFKTPNPITFLSKTYSSVEVRWKSPDDDSIMRHSIIFIEARPGVQEWDHMYHMPTMTRNNTEYIENVTGLEPNTMYTFGIKAFYRFRPFDKAVYTWPPKLDLYMYKTAPFIPAQALPPLVSHLHSGAYEVSWEEPDDNGAIITLYILEYRDHEKELWKIAYEGPEERWIVEESKLDNGHSYFFRVSAINSLGRSPFSDNSTLFLASYGKALEGSFTNELTIGIIVGSILLLGLFVAVIVLILRKRFVKIKTHQFIIRGPDTELATLRELPQTTFQQSNTLYAISIQCTDEEIAKLPHFSRSQLVLHTFLGSGAFGEVFEGFAKNILGDESGETKCAVKTLRKCASDQEKQEFLKEALLMKNFQHEHILGLLGVCLDNDPQFIIMELMEGGDLLSFIRSCRATSTTPAKLMLPELVKICVHVARGCKYLEDMHFVHRDLAARNCLVSSTSPSNMIVKIGDFGLARDIYKNDYYRKEGEGLLPVRWMSPESLVDGFFTTQSDIWAFGVMMWEVITLGQQPYPARSNIEVLHFVRAGGKLERPEKCADEMYSLMRKCWSFDAEERPCFADILSTLEEFEEKCLHMTFEEIARLSPLSVDANRELGAWMREDEEEENEETAETRGLFTPKCQTITGGGSVRSTQSDKAKRLSDLLGTTDKQVVDLTKIKRKRNHSDSKQYSPISSSPYHHTDFPAAGEYDHHGYLEPRGAKGGNRYLDLLNYAPELRTLLDSNGKPLVSGSGSAFTPFHITHKSYHPSNPAYTLVAHDEEQEEEIPYGHIVGKGQGAGIHSVDNPNYALNQHQGNAAMNDYPIYAEVCDARRHNSTDSTGGRYTDYHYNSPSFSATMTKSPRRKFSDQDLYSSPASYRQYSDSESNADHRYTSLECNNNNNNHNSYGYAPYAQTRHGSSNSNRSGDGSMNNYHHYAKPDMYSSFNQELCVDLTSHPNPKPSTSQNTWANNPDDVFLESDPQFDTNGQFNNQGHNNSSRTRRQVFPECNPDFSNYSYGHVSLV